MVLLLLPEPPLEQAANEPTTVAPATRTLRSFVRIISRPLAVIQPMFGNVSIWKRTHDTGEESRLSCLHSGRNRHNGRTESPSRQDHAMTQPTMRDVAVLANVGV